MANITNKINKVTGENIQAQNVTIWFPPGNSTPITLSTINEPTYLGGLYNKDSTGYFKWMTAGDFPVSRLTNIIFDNFRKLCTDFGTLPITIVIDKVVPVTSNLVIKPNITFRIENGGGFNISSGINFTINGNVVAGNYQIFFGTGYSIINQTLTALIDWYGAVGDGIVDDSSAIQKAFDSVIAGTIVFNRGKIYAAGGLTEIRIRKSNMIIDGNGCTVIPFLKGSVTIFSVSHESATANNIKIIENVAIKNFLVDAKYSGCYFCTIRGGEGMYLNNISITDGKYYNSTTDSNSFINITGITTLKSGILGRTDNILIERNTFENFGKNLGLSITSDYPPGAINLAISTGDPSRPILDKIQVNEFFRIASYKGQIQAGTQFFGTNSVYQIISFTQTSLSTGIITIASGAYNNTSGWIVDTINAGLAVDIKKNAALIPPIRYYMPQLTYWPMFNFIAGSNVATRTSNTAEQNARAKTLFVGSEFYFFEIRSDLFKITAIDASTGSITFDKPYPLMYTTRSLTLYRNTNMGNSISIIGECRVVIRNNTFKYSERGIGGTIVTLNGCTIGESTAYLLIENNTFFGQYFPVEFGNNPFLCRMLFTSFSVTKGSSQLIIGKPAEYKYVSKDINGDDIAEDCLSPVTTTDVTYLNSFVVGDLLNIVGVRGSYLITDIPSDWATNPIITVSRYNRKTQLMETGGFLNSAIVTSFVTAYENPVLKIYRQFKELIINNNIIGDNFAEALSVGCYSLAVTNNKINCNINTLELFAENAIVDNNQISTNFWNGEFGRIGTCNTYNSLFGPLASSCWNLKFTRNQIDTFDYSRSNSSGQNTLLTTVGDPGEIIVYDNVFNGISGMLFNVGSLNINIDGYVYLKHIYYKSFIFEKNKIILNSKSSTSSLMHILADFTEVVNNTFIFSEGTAVYGKIFLANQPNPDLYAIGEFNIFVVNNVFTKKVPWATDLSLMKIEELFIEKSGTYTTDGKLLQTTITIPHNLGSIPTYTNVNPKSVDARNAGIISWTENAINIIITLAREANVGSSNLSYSWEAKI